MRLYSGKISPIADEIVKALTSTGDIEVTSQDEVRMDIEAVLKEFLRLDREIVDEAKSRMEARGLGYGQLTKTKAQVSKERGAPPPDEQLPYILDQVLNMLFHSSNVEEIFAEDADLRKKLTTILKKHMEVEDELDKEVRARIKNLEEGTASFEIEYAKVMEQMKKKKGLS